MIRWSAALCAGALLLAPRSAAAQAPSHDAARAAPANGIADDREKEARSRYERGLQLYGEGAAEGALVEFERAYQLAPSYRLLYNIALIRLQLNDYAQALKAFQEYLAEGGAEIPSVRRSEVERQISGLKNRIGRVEITSNARGADVSVDDVVVGRIPLAEPLVLNPGRRRIAITRGGSTSATVVSIAGQDSLKVELSLETAAPPPAAHPRAASQPSRAPVYVSWTVTAGLAAATTVVGLLAVDAMSDLDDARKRIPATRAELDAAESKMNRLALTTDILAGATVLAAATALYFTLSKPSEGTSATGSTRIGFGPAALNFEHRF